MTTDPAYAAFMGDLEAMAAIGRSGDPEMRAQAIATLELLLAALRARYEATRLRLVPAPEAQPTNSRPARGSRTAPRKG